MKVGDIFFTLHLDDDLIFDIEEEEFTENCIPYKDWDVSDKVRTFLSREDAEQVRNIISKTIRGMYNGL